jgi:hypothetical protein
MRPETIDDISRESGMPKEDLLTQLSRLLPDGSSLVIVGTYRQAERRAAGPKTDQPERRDQLESPWSCKGVAMIV